MNVNGFTQTPGVEVTAQHSEYSPNAQFQKKKTRSDNQLKPILKTNLNSVASSGIISPPDGFISVDKANRYHYRLTLSDPISASTPTQPHKNQIVYPYKSTTQAVFQELFQVSCKFHSSESFTTAKAEPPWYSSWEYLVRLFQEATRSF